MIQSLNNIGSLNVFNTEKFYDVGISNYYTYIYHLFINSYLYTPVNGPLYDIAEVDKNTSPTLHSISLPNVDTLSTHLLDSSAVNTINFSAFINLYFVNSILFSNNIFLYIPSSASFLNFATFYFT